jgi:hypothetical protein
LRALQPSRWRVHKSRNARLHTATSGYRDDGCHLHKDCYNSINIIRLDTELLKRGLLGWLCGEQGHCSMAHVPTIDGEDAKRPNRKRECLVEERTRIVNRISLRRLPICPAFQSTAGVARLGGATTGLLMHLEGFSAEN